MLRAARGQQQAQAIKRSWNVVLFSVGGKRLAARAEEVGGVSPWIESIPVPSRTPFVQAMLKRGSQVMPVYDLAAQLNCQPQGDALLCLVARHIDGPLAICIDADVPSLASIDVSAIRSSVRDDLHTLGSVTIDGEDVAIVALQRLGQVRQEAARS